MFDEAVSMSREWESLSGEVRELVESHQDDAPVKLSAMANALGLKVLSSTLPPGISGEIRPRPGVAGEFTIRVNRHDPARRQRFTIAHEIAHYLLHKDRIGTGVADDVLYRSSLSDRREAEANRLAADILMPPTLIEAWLDNARLLKVDDVVGYLADRFEVSEASMKIRLGLS